jgi:hypothetical protein
MLYAFLRSHAAYTQIKSLPYGGSIPHFDAEGLGSIIVPRLPSSIEKQIADSTLAALEKRDKSFELEMKAAMILESAIIREAAR